jgi:hypothetical protein
VAELAAVVTGFDRTGDLVTLATWAIALAGLLTAWVAVLAAGIAWAGWRLRRPARVAAAGSAPGAGGPVAGATGTPAG